MAKKMIQIKGLFALKYLRYKDRITGCNYPMVMSGSEAAVKAVKRYKNLIPGKILSISQKFYLFIIAETNIFSTVFPVYAEKYFGGNSLVNPGDTSQWVQYYIYPERTRIIHFSR